MRTFDPTIDYYAELELTPAATEKEISSAYKRLASKYHPDRHQGNDLEDLARQKLENLNAAYDVLKDPDRRRQYDAARLQRNSGRPPGRHRASVPRGPVFDAKRFVRTLAIVGGLTLLMRFVRSPRVFLSTVAIIAALWLVPKLFRKLFRKK